MRGPDSEAALARRRATALAAGLAAVASLVVSNRLGWTDAPEPPHSPAPARSPAAIRPAAPVETPPPVEPTTTPRGGTGADAGAHDHAAGLPTSVDLDVVSVGSVVLVLELAAESVTLVDAVEKRDLPFRRLNARDPGAYRYRVRDAGAVVLHTGTFDVLDLCPYAGPDHEDAHVIGHVVLEHASSVLLRVPRLSGAATIEFLRALPGVDPTPRPLGSALFPRS